MAADEGLLAAASRGPADPVLRLYTWDPSAVSIGKFQDEGRSCRRAECERRGIDIVRRATGGRSVLHYRELTYSIIARTDDPLFPNEILGTYKVIAQGLLAGLQRLGVPAELVSRSGRHAGKVRPFSREPACFSSPSWFEVVARGRKIAGSAQRRISGAFLQHGSVLIEYDPDLEAAVIPGGGQAGVVTCIRDELGRAVAVDEVKHALLKGFAETFGTAFDA
jgi:lipoate-protein ligase A